MKNLRLLLLIAASMLFVLNSKAQDDEDNLPGTQWYASFRTPTRVTFTGDVTALKDLEGVNIVYDYSHMAVAKFATEHEYLDDETKDYLHDAFRVEDFRMKWFAARKEQYEPKFEKLFNKYAGRIGMEGENYSKKAPVTLRIETIYLHPGSQKGRQPATVNLKCTFVDRSGKEIVCYTLENIWGGNPPVIYSTFEERIRESYAKAARVLAKNLVRQLRKFDVAVAKICKKIARFFERISDKIEKL